MPDNEKIKDYSKSLEDPDFPSSLNNTIHSPNKDKNKIRVDVSDKNPNPTGGK